MRRRGWSAGTIAMMIFTAVVLCCTAWAILNIRGGKENLTMDAERLSGSVGALVASLQSTEAPAVTAMAFTQAPAVMDETAPMITAPPMTAQPAATQAPGVRRTLTLTVGGAFVPTTRIYNGAMKGGEYRPGLPFGGIADVLHADINIAMLDVSAISGDNAWWAQAMKSAGFDCVVPLRENARDSARVDVLHTLSAALPRPRKPSPCILSTAFVWRRWRMLRMPPKQEAGSLHSMGNCCARMFRLHVPRGRR